MQLPLTKSLAAVLLAAVVLVSTGGVILAATPVAVTAVGYDISFPQCGHAYPSSPGFGVVGVNDGSPFSVNKCLASELTWAQSSAFQEPAFYANTAAPGPAFTSNWPTSQTTPDVCNGANTVPCAYDYGWNAARESFANAVAAETTNGAASPSASALAASWWLDVETGNAWEVKAGFYGPTGAAYANDLASVAGEVASLTNIGVTSIGIYSTSQQWRAITNAGVDAAPAVPTWIPGFGSLASAETGCYTTSFTSQRVAMTQYGSNGYDGDYACGLLSAPTVTTSTVAGSATYTNQVLVSNNSGPVTFTQTSGSPAIVVSSSGAVTTSGQLAAGIYVAAGTTADTHGDTGTFSLTVQVGELIQSSPTTASVKASGSAAFTQQLVVPDGSNPVTFVQSAGAPDLTVSASGLIATNGPLVTGSYVASGTTSDTAGDTGVFTFSLKVGVLVQRAPTAASTTTTASATYSQQLDVGANLGAVSYVQTGGSPNLVVSATGLLTTSGALAKGTYVASGTTSDPTGDQGTFTFTLTVTGAATTPPVTPPATPGPLATSISGYVVAGRTVTLSIHGENFYGRPKVTSHAGTTASVTRDTGTVLVVRVSAKAHSRNGVFTFTITLANGKSCQVKYNQRP